MQALAVTNPAGTGRCEEGSSLGYSRQSTHAFRRILMVDNHCECTFARVIYRRPTYVSFSKLSVAMAGATQQLQQAIGFEMIRWCGASISRVSFVRALAVAATVL
jgi:hypothetical protein